MLQKGKECAEVARSVGVARQTVYVWKRILQEQGIDALRAMGDKGRPAALGERDLRWLHKTLLAGAQVSGFSTDLWTLKRVGAVLKRELGVSFSNVHIWRILGQMGFSSQKPERSAIERDEEAVQTWRTKTWPALKKKPKKRGE
jgi:transposase